MKVGVISDTHDRLPTFRRALALFKRLEVDALFHAGDFVAPFAAKLMSADHWTTPLYCVYGNNDGEREGLKAVLPGVTGGPLRVEIGGRIIVMHHWIEQIPAARMEGVDVVISGHTHAIVNEHQNGCLTLNPGECCGWITDRCTVAVLDLDALTAEIIEVHD